MGGCSLKGAAGAETVGEYDGGWPVPGGISHDTPTTPLLCGLARPSHIRGLVAPTPTQYAQGQPSHIRGLVAPTPLMYVSGSPSLIRGLTGSATDGVIRYDLWSGGTWCSGITSASHAEGPGFKSRCVHCRSS